MKNKNWFWGSFFLLAAIFVIALQTGSFGQIGVMSIIASLLLVAIIIQSIVRLNFFGIFVPVAFLYKIFSKPLDFPELSIWLLLLAAVLASIGFSIIFKTHPKKSIHHSFTGDEHFNKTVEDTDDNNPYAKVSFGATSKYLHSDCLKSGQFFVSFGALELFFDQAQLSPEGAEIFIDCSFGAAKLFVPKHWRVVDKMHTSLGGVDNHVRYSEINADSPTLTLTGNVQFSGVEIKYI